MNANSAAVLRAIGFALFLSSASSLMAVTIFGMGWGTLFSGIASFGFVLVAYPQVKRNS